MITDADRLYIRDASDQDLAEELRYTRDEEYAVAIRAEQNRRMNAELSAMKPAQMFREQRNSQMGEQVRDHLRGGQ